MRPILSRALLPLFAFLLPSAGLRAQGTFPPASGPTVPVMKTLAQIETRTPIPGGAASFNITAPGSYYLTGNLTVANFGSGITINASDVTLDLNGFTISGSTSVDNNTAGILSSSPQKNIVICNGAISHCLLGISFSSSSSSQNVTIEKVRFHDLYRVGIVVSSEMQGMRIDHCTISQIGSGASTTVLSSYGITASGGCTIEDCVIDGVAGSDGGTGTGIDVDQDAVCIGNTISNCSSGILHGIARNNTLIKCSVGLNNCKYQNNLTYSCTTPFVGGTDAGGNN